jgi:hypothetical protein
MLSMHDELRENVKCENQQIASWDRWAVRIKTYYYMPNFQTCRTKSINIEGLITTINIVRYLKVESCYRDNMRTS